MRIVLLALSAFTLLAPPASAGAEGDCRDTDIGLVCIGDYSWTEGDGGCSGDTVQESGSGVWTETIAGDASASGFTYCNVYYDSAYHESGVRARVDTAAVFLEVSWNKWYYDDPTQHLEGCSTWVYYVGPLYGYYNNVYCPAGDPPSEDWGNVWPDGAAAPVPNGCTFLPGVYYCVAEEAAGCDGFTGIGGGASGLAGATIGGFDSCGNGTFVASGSVGVFFVNAGWSEAGGSCSMWLYANSLPFLTAPCAPGGMPEPGWGSLLP